MRQHEMKSRWIAAGFAVAFLVASAASATASTWDERTILGFSEPVMVPGTTLPSGSYVFELLGGSRDIVRITTEDGSDTVALVQAIPLKRSNPNGDIVVNLAPTDVGLPPALKAWFYPGSSHDHELLYSEEQAKRIASRAKSIVLAVDVPGTDVEKGTLRTYDAAGKTAQWRDDGATSAAPMIESDFQGKRVKLDELEDYARKYIGQTVSVDAEVENVLGPRLFTIDEPDRGDLDPEILVHLSAAMLAPLREQDRVTVTGSLKPFDRDELVKAWGWQTLDGETEADLVGRPVLVATRIVGGNDDVAMAVNVDPARPQPLGKAPAMHDLDAIALEDESLVGRRVSLDGVEIESLAEGQGFFVKTAVASLFVLPTNAEMLAPKAGDRVAIEGVVLELPGGVEDRLDAPEDAVDDIYIYSTSPIGASEAG